MTSVVLRVLLYYAFRNQTKSLGPEIILTEIFIEQLFIYLVICLLDWFNFVLSTIYSQERVGLTSRNIFSALATSQARAGNREKQESILGISLGLFVKIIHYCVIGEKSLLRQSLRRPECRYVYLLSYSLTSCIYHVYTLFVIILRR